MKLSVSIVLLCLFCLVATICISAKSKTVSAENILKKVSAELSGLKTVSYTVEHENNAATNGFYDKRRIESFLDFTSGNKFIGVRYQLVYPANIYIFNGSDYFFLNKKSKTYNFWKNPDFHDFENAGLHESLLTLKNSLPKLLADETVEKSVGEQPPGSKKVYVVKLVLDGKVINFNGEYFLTTPGIKFTYRLTIDKSTYLPLEILRTNNANSNTEKSSFEYQLTKLPPAETSWYYSSYASEYKPATPLINTTLKAGQLAPDWTLPEFRNDDSISLNQYKGKVVLVEFWISFCGFCIKAVPDLNLIAEKYKDKEFRLSAVNDDDPGSIIQKFENIYKPKYQILYSGRETAKKYGINGYPSVFVIDKTGKIIYSGGGVDGNLIDQLIEKALSSN